MKSQKIKFYTGWYALPVRLKFRISMLRYLFQKKKFPLFIVKSSKGGILRSAKMLKKLKICKIVRHEKHYYFSLTVPHWPSKPFDNMVANGGLNITAVGTPYKQQVDTAILGITRRCSYKCNHCYEHFNLFDEDILSVSRLIQVIGTLQDHGVSIITFSGGEPMLRYKGLMELLESGDKSRSDFHIHTSGFGVTSGNASALKKAGLQAAGVGLDDVEPERHDALRGYKGAFEQAIMAIKNFQDAGIFTYVNTCLTQELIRSGDFIKYFELLKSLNVGIVRWLEPKPCGAYLNEIATDLLSEADKAFITELYIRANTGIDYINYPQISYEAFSEAPENMGCMMGGNSLLYVDSVGNVEPCVFLPVTFGNIMKEDMSDIFARMRNAIPKPLHTICPSILLNQKIRDMKEYGLSLPIPYEKIKEEFDELII